MRKKIAVVTGISFGILLLGIGAFLVFQNVRYADLWYPGTVINGLDVSGHTLEESKKMFAETYSGYALEISARDNGKLVIQGDAIGYSIQPNSEWDDLFLDQHESVLLFSPVSGDDDAAYDIVYQKEKLTEQIEQSELVLGSSQYKIHKPVSAYVKYDKSKKQFVCIKEEEGNVVQVPAFIEAVEKALQGGMQQIDIADSVQYPDIYQEPELRSDDEGITKEMDLCNQAIMRFVTWDMGEGVTVSITPQEIAQWITYENGSILYDDEAVSDWVEDFCLRFKTVGKTRNIKDHNGEIVPIVGGDYGWALDYAATLEQAKSALKKEFKMKATQAYMKNQSAANQKALTVQEEPSYLNTAYQKDYENFTNDWDPLNYTEVDLEEQMVYVIRDGKVAFSCRCITGRPVEGRMTPTGAYYVKEHRLDYTLTGADYRTPVKNWVRVTWTGTGFHPATWQPWSRWTNTLYQTKGSHGCINLEPKDAEVIYEMLPYREAVFIH